MQLFSENDSRFRGGCGDLRHLYPKPSFFRDTTLAGSRGPVTGSGRLAAYQRLTTSLGATLRVRDALCPPEPDQVPQWSHKTCCGPGSEVATKRVPDVYEARSRTNLPSQGQRLRRRRIAAPHKPSCSLCQQEVILGLNLTQLSTQFYQFLPLGCG